jgi:hypothetical protein
MKGVHDIAEIISINLGSLAVSLTFHCVAFDIAGIKCFVVPLYQEHKAFRSRLFSPHTVSRI